MKRPLRLNGAPCLSSKNRALTPSMKIKRANKYILYRKLTIKKIKMRPGDLFSFRPQ